ncbi:TadA family conjugal transfer-associated ATPase [Mumia zhuanghuii]|uniref:TadA family conjugal transfer-associated ATPase n=1 Tax=Mumia zhuanghuii TaxID=2585211 RepID=A0A5C4N0H4_9ACTN|nr:TadA family conjugal transfer-associated ATPase [Mumia zhuanghuii]TNC49732.1 TadA family conjugal transfer-associated ATPase [Mumia zhuanghuii]TNC49963.1 TadA family conjugal transfer-associated ATPase [Mumia zhuanghuii]
MRRTPRRPDVRPVGPAGEVLAASLVEETRDRIAAAGERPTADRVAAALRAAGHVHGDRTVLAVVDALHRETVGAGPLERLLRADGVTDVLVNGPAHVYVDRGSGLERADVTFADDDAVRRLAQRLAAAAGRRLDDASPFVDVRLPDGTRLHAVLSPLARPGTALSLRVPARRAYSLDELAGRGAFTGEIHEVLTAVVRARAAFLVTGGTGTGKTTLLAAMLGAVPPAERLLLVEDASELRPDHPHVVALESRPANVEGAGAVVLRDLVRQALRMRPDRLVVGEVRGAEVVDLLGALNTGHEGGCGTLHANTPRDVPARVEALAMAAGMPRAAVHSQLGAALDLVVHVARDSTGRRRVAEIATLRSTADGTVVCETAVSCETGGTITHGPGRARLDEVLARRGAGGSEGAE